MIEISRLKEIENEIRETRVLDLQNEEYMGALFELKQTIETIITVSKSRIWKKL